jgi:hypothetical protein
MRDVTSPAVGHDRTRPQNPLPDGPLSAAVTTALRSWLQAQRNAHVAGAAVRAAEVHATMRLLGAEARQRGVQVEQLIVLLKELWSALPPAPAASARDVDFRDRRDLLDGIVRACIEEFYAPSPSATGSDGDGATLRA